MAVAAGGNGILSHITWRNAAIGLGSALLTAIPVLFFISGAKEDQLTAAFRAEVARLEARFDAAHQENMDLYRRMRLEVDQARAKFQEDVASAGHELSRSILADFRREVQVTERLLDEHRKIDVHDGAVTQRELVLIRERFAWIERQLDALVKRFLADVNRSHNRLFPRQPSGLRSAGKRSPQNPKHAHDARPGAADDTFP